MTKHAQKYIYTNLPTHYHHLRDSWASELTSSACHVLAYLSAIQKKGRVEVFDLPTVAKKAHVSLSSVKRAVTQLEEKGFLHSTTRSAQSGARRFELNTQKVQSGERFNNVDKRLTKYFTKNEAKFLTKLQYLIRTTTMEEGGLPVIKRTQVEWAIDMGVSVRTMKRICATFKRHEFFSAIRSTKYETVYCYHLDTKKLDRWVEKLQPHPVQEESRRVQNQLKLAPGSAQIGTSYIDNNKDKNTLVLSEKKTPNSVDNSKLDERTKSFSIFFDSVSSLYQKIIQQKLNYQHFVKIYSSQQKQIADFFARKFDGDLEEIEKYFKFVASSRFLLGYKSAAESMKFDKWQVSLIWLARDYNHHKVTSNHYSCGEHHCMERDKNDTHDDNTRRPQPTLAEGTLAASRAKNDTHDEKTRGPQPTIAWGRAKNDTHDAKTGGPQVTLAESLLQSYNKIVGSDLSVPHKLTKAPENLLQVFKEHFNSDYAEWEEYLARCARAPILMGHRMEQNHCMEHNTTHQNTKFCRLQDRRGQHFQVSLWWLVQPANITKLKTEGYFDLSRLSAWSAAQMVDRCCARRVYETAAPTPNQTPVATAGQGGFNSCSVVPKNYSPQDLEERRSLKEKLPSLEITKQKILKRNWSNLSTRAIKHLIEQVEFSSRDHADGYYLLVTKGAADSTFTELRECIERYTYTCGGHTKTGSLQELQDCFGVRYEKAEDYLRGDVV